MPALHELQERVAGVLLGAQEPDSLGDCLGAGRIPLASRLAVHRNTVRGGLCQALRLRYPSVARLLGEDGFDRAALAFAAGDWPRAPQQHPAPLGRVAARVSAGARRCSRVCAQRLAKAWAKRRRSGAGVSCQSA